MTASLALSRGMPARNPPITAPGSVLPTLAPKPPGAMAIPAPAPRPATTWPARSSVTWGAEMTKQFPGAGGGLTVKT